DDERANVGSGANGSILREVAGGAGIPAGEERATHGDARDAPRALHIATLVERSIRARDAATDDVAPDFDGAGAFVGNHEAGVGRVAPDEGASDGQGADLRSEDDPAGLLATPGHIAADLDRTGMLGDRDEGAGAESSDHRAAESEAGEV